MSGKFETRLCMAIIEDLFGKIVGKVASVLLRESCNLPSLGFLLKNQVSLKLIRKSLITLIHFGFVKFAIDGKKPIYFICPEIIQRWLLAPRTCFIAKQMFGLEAEMICEELFSQGKLTVSNVVRRCHSRDSTIIWENIRKNFVDLAEARFVLRMPSVNVEMTQEYPIYETDFDPFQVPTQIFEQREAENVQMTGRKRKIEDGKDVDEGKYWKINWNKIDAHLRDEMIVESLVGDSATSTDRTEIITRQVCQLIFKLNEGRHSPLRPPVLDNITATAADLLKLAKKHDYNMTRADIELACQILVDESEGIMTKLSADGWWQIDGKRAIRRICQKHCESLIREQFGIRSIRIMRLLEMNNYLDEEQVEKKSMLSGKEAREVLYALVEEGFVFTKAIGRSTDFLPARTFYLYYVDLTRTVRGLVEYTCKLINNLIIRHAHEKKEIKQLLDKEATVEPIVEGIRANEELDEESKLAQIAEVEEMYLPGPDRAQLNKFRQAQTVLLSSQEQSAKVLLAFKLFLSSAEKV